MRSTQGQGFLFEMGTPDMKAHTFPPNVHADGPASEREAAEKSAHTRQRNCDIVLAIIRRNPSSTCDELWAAATEDERGLMKEMMTVRRRVVDLKAEGRIVADGMRECRVKGNRMMTVRATT